MDVEKVHKELIRETGAPIIKAQWVDRYVESPISFWCQFNAPPETRDPINPFQQHLFDLGNQHQSNVTSELYPGAVQKVFFTEQEW